MAIGTIRDGNVIRIGDDTLRAKQQADVATLAAGAAAAAGRYFPSQAAGEAGSATGQFFSHPDGAGGLVYRERTADGSTVIGNAATSAQVAAVATQATTASAQAATASAQAAAASAQAAAASTQVTAFGADGGANLIGFKAATGGKSRTVQSRVRESVSLADYWTPGDPTSALAAAFANAFVDGRFLELPKSFDGMSFPAAGITVPADKGVIVGARMVGAAGSSLIQAAGTGEFHFEGGHLQDVSLVLRGGTPRVYNLSASGRANTQAILFQGLGGATFTNALFAGLNIQGANYGLLAQGSAHASTNLQILDGRFYDLRGDAIELNVCPNDRNTLIRGHTIDLIDGTTVPNWGIAVGVANMSDLAIDDVQISRVRQGVHAEYSTRFTISNVRTRDVSATYGPGTGLEVAGVVTYGCDSFSISEVRGSGDVRVLFGAPGGVYSVGSKNFAVRGVGLDSGNLTVMAGPLSSDTDSYATVNDVFLASGQFQFGNYCHRTTLRDIQAILPRASGQAVLLQPGLNIDGRYIFKPTNERVTRMIVENVAGYDEFGADSVAYRTNGGIIKAPVLLGFSQQRVRTRECNFATSGGTAYRGVNREIIGDFGGAGVPYGMELFPNDLCIDTNATTPGRSAITAPGSRNRGADNFVLFDKANRVLKSTNLGWPAANQHEAGQRIDCSNIGASGAALSTTVVRCYSSGGNTLMEIADAPLTGSDGTTTGTITATQTATWQAV